MSGIFNKFSLEGTKEWLKNASETVLNSSPVAKVSTFVQEKIPVSQISSDYQQVKDKITDFALSERVTMIIKNGYDLKEYYFPPGVKGYDQTEYKIKGFMYFQELEDFPIFYPHVTTIDLDEAEYVLVEDIIRMFKKHPSKTFALTNVKQDLSKTLNEIQKKNPGIHLLWGEQDKVLKMVKGNK